MRQSGKPAQPTRANSTPVTPPAAPRQKLEAHSPIKRWLEEYDAAQRRGDQAEMDRLARREPRKPGEPVRFISPKTPDRKFSTQTRQSLEYAQDLRAKLSYRINRLADLESSRKNESHYTEIAKLSSEIADLMESIKASQTNTGYQSRKPSSSAISTPSAPKRGFASSSSKPTFVYSPENGKNNSYDRMLLEAVEMNEVILARYALKQGASLHVRCDYKNEPVLHAAVRLGNKEMVKLLIAYGANPQEIYVEQTAIQASEDKEITTLLIKALQSEVPGEKIISKPANGGHRNNVAPHRGYSTFRDSLTKKQCELLDRGVLNDANRVSAFLETLTALQRQALQQGGVPVGSPSPSDVMALSEYANADLGHVDKLPVSEYANIDQLGRTGELQRPVVGAYSAKLELERSQERQRAAEGNQASRGGKC